MRFIIAASALLGLISGVRAQSLTFVTTKTATAPSANSYNITNKGKLMMQWSQAKGKTDTWILKDVIDSKQDHVLQTLPGNQLTITSASSAGLTFAGTYDPQGKTVDFQIGRQNAAAFELCGLALKGPLIRGCRQLPNELSPGNSASGLPDADVDPRKTNAITGEAFALADSPERRAYWALMFFLDTLP